MPEHERTFVKKTVAIILYATLTVGSCTQILAKGQPHQDASTAVIRTRIEALLGGYETSASPEQWRSLGSTAAPILAAIAIDKHALPTHRARSLEGLASLGGGNSSVIFENLAYSEQEPLIVRMSAIRGLGQLLPESQRISTLRPLLRATHAQLRGVTAEVLSRVPGGCAAVRKQADEETEAWRSRFARDCSEPGASPGEATIARRDSSQAVAQLASAGTSGGPGQFIIPLGTFQVFTDHINPITVNIPATAISFEFVGVAADLTARVVVYKIVDPSGTVIYNYASSSNIAKIMPSLLPGSFSVLLPNSPSLTFGPGLWTFYLLGAKATTANVDVVFETSPAPVIDANIFFVGVANLSAQSAPSDPNFQQVLSKVSSIYSQIGVTLGKLTYIDITGPDATRFTDVMDSDLASLFQLSGDPRARFGAVNIFLVHSITSGSTLNGYIILGEAGGIPGAPVLGATSSGLAVTMADFPSAPDEIGQTVAHETGHWLGLFHTTESNGLAFDPLADTPQCPQNPYDTNHDGIMEPQECVNLDATNIMFWTSVTSIPNNLLTPNQGFVILRNPVQNAANVTATAGTPQTGIVGNTYPAALQVTLMTLASSLENGVRVDFSSPSSGPSCLFPNGTASYSALTDTNGNASASCTANMQIGSYSVTATPVTLGQSATFALTNIVSTSDTISTSLNPNPINTQVMLSANVSQVQIPGPAPGTVSFYDGASLLGTLPLSAGIATLPVTFSSTGVHSISASYMGDAVHLASTATLSQVVVSSASTASSTNLLVNGVSNPPTIYFGVATGQRQTVTFTVTVSGGSDGDQVVLLDGDFQLGPALALSSGNAHFTSQLPVGQHNVRAVYIGNGTTAGSASLVVTVNRSPRPKPR